MSIKMWEREAMRKRNKILYHLEVQCSLHKKHTSKMIIPPLDKEKENKANKSKRLRS